MLNISVFPSDASVCSLSDIVETGAVPQRYCLSPKACGGLLRRAASRGKDNRMPVSLRRALEGQTRVVAHVMAHVTAQGG